MDNALRPGDRASGLLAGRGAAQAVKRIAFLAVMLAPLAILLILVLATALDLLRLRAVEPATLSRELESHLRGKQPRSLPLPDGLRAPAGGRTRVFLFGESSLVLSDGSTFPEYLARLRHDLDVVNLGVSGIDSFSVRRRVTEAVAAARPDVIVLYYGHNDYNNAYQGFVLPRHFDRFALLLRVAFAFRDRAQPRGVLLADDSYWFSRLMRPRIVKALQRAGLVDLGRFGFSALDDLVLRSYRRNNEAVLDLAASLGIPVVLVTPVGNLRAEPFGDLATATRRYREGMAAADYREALRLLRLARDAESLTYDLRAKSPLLDYLRQCERPGVHLLDLERRLEEMRFGFGYADFLDYFHFNDRSHRVVAAILADFLAQRGLIGPDPGPQRGV